MENFSTSLLKRKRLLHTILLTIILTTLPCYCAGAMLLGLAPDRGRVRITPTAVTSTIEPTLLTVVGPTATLTLFPTITPLPLGQYTNTPIFGGPVSTPGQFVPPTSTPRPVLTPTLTFTLPPTATVWILTSTRAPTVTPTFTWTWTLTPTSTTQAAPTSTFTSTPTFTLTPTVQAQPTNTEPPMPTPTPEVFDEQAGGQGQGGS